MQGIEVRGVSKSFRDTAVFEDLSCVVKKGQILWLIGPSGCGKTTLLRLVAGLEQPDKGEILINGVLAGGTDVHLPPAERNVGMVFQDFALWPHMSVKRHLDFVLKAKRLHRENRLARISKLLDLCGLQQHAHARPRNLSGGEQQRLAIARALATDPPTILMDEPFSNLDAGNRERLFSEVLRRKCEECVSVIIAAHDGYGLVHGSDRVLHLDNNRGAHCL